MLIQKVEALMHRRHVRVRQQLALALALRQPQAAQLVPKTERQAKPRRKRTGARRGKRQLHQRVGARLGARPAVGQETEAVLGVGSPQRAGAQPALSLGVPRAGHAAQQQTGQKQGAQDRAVRQPAQASQELRLEAFRQDEAGRTTTVPCMLHQGQVMHRLEERRQHQEVQLRLKPVLQLLRRLLRLYRKKGDGRLLRKNSEMSWICIHRRRFTRLILFG
jgi:hypothetical protein